MRIYAMTATFGKLENQTLRLEPGLNIISAPNEWGKSTWCAFLTVMLYGLDTRAKTTKTALAEKERFAPWSGAPMSGRIELSWQGKDITIERRAKGRTPMGEFLAYETATGLPVPELTATTCGQTLLGVECSVFQRSGFITLSDMPVTQDESLRRRLNALVTTGDESRAGDDLAQTLKDLKNKCRYNRSGLIPQALEEQEKVQRALEELDGLEQQRQAAQEKQNELDAFARQLENHKVTLAFEAAQAGQKRLEAAADACDTAAKALEAAEKTCRQLPDPMQAQKLSTQAANLRQRRSALQMDGQMLPAEPPVPDVQEAYWDIRAVAQAQADQEAYRALEKRKKQHSTWIYGYCAVAAVLVGLSLWLQNFLLAAVAVGLGVALGAVCILRTKRIQRDILVLFDKYPGLRPEVWAANAQNQYGKVESYRMQQEAALQQRRQWRREMDSLEETVRAFTGGESLEAVEDRCALAIRAFETQAQAQREYQRCLSHAEALRQDVKTAPKPEFADELTFDTIQTQRHMEDTQFQQKQLQLRLGQYQGRMEALGSREVLVEKLQKLESRLLQLNRTYDALEIALQTLASASAELQRRFAPRIAQQAQALFSRMTGGRYERLLLSEDFTVSTAAREENTLHSAQWRSEGTTDQLYLALRLAVSRALIPAAPIVLDDALARFDDTRLAAAMEILKEEAESRQVILFTCQGREKME